MKVILATHNRYLEEGLSLLLKAGYRVVTAREFFMPSNRWHVPDINESWLIISDALLGRLMRCLFQGRHFLQLDAECLRGVEDIQEGVRNGVWSNRIMYRALTMSEMVVMFGYVYRQSCPCRLASEMGVHTKTVNTFLYMGMAKNGLQGRSVKLLAMMDDSRGGMRAGASGKAEIR